MTCVEMLPSMTDLMDRQKIVGWIVRDGITNQGITYSEAARRWPISLPTLNRLMSSGNVGMRFLRLAERNLDLPHKLFDLVIDGDVERIRNLAGLEPTLRDYIVRELGGSPSGNDVERGKTRRKA